MSLSTYRYLVAAVLILSSERIARREDVLELEAEKRREEEKRRKRRERELLTKRQPA